MTKSPQDEAERLKKTITQLRRMTVANGCTPAEAATAAAKAAELSARFDVVEKNASAARAAEEKDRVAREAQAARAAAEKAEAARYQQAAEEKARAAREAQAAEAKAQAARDAREAAEKAETVRYQQAAEEKARAARDAQAAEAKARAARSQNDVWFQEFLSEIKIEADKACETNDLNMMRMGRYGREEGLTARAKRDGRSTDS